MCPGAWQYLNEHYLIEFCVAPCYSTLDWEPLTPNSPSNVGGPAVPANTVHCVCLHVPGGGAHEVIVVALMFF